MRRETRIALALLSVLAAGCQAPSSDCGAALQTLDRCMAASCAQSDSPTCQRFASRSLLFGARAGQCATLSASQIESLSAGRCDDAASAFAAAGKADDGRPPFSVPGTDAADEGFTIKVLSQSASELVIELLIHDVSYTTRVKDGVTYHELSVKNAGRVPEVGRPLVPIWNPMLAVPEDTARAWVKRIDVDPADRQVVSGINLVPYQRDTVEDEPPATLVVDRDFYARDAWYPGQDINQQPLQVATWRNVRVIRGTMAPVQFNPARALLTITKRVVVTVGIERDPLAARETIGAGAETFARAYERSLVNYYEHRDGRGDAGDSATRTRYLVIAKDELVDAVQPLLAQKQAEGVTTALVRSSELLLPDELRPRPETIKATIRKYYDEQSIEFVLLVGNVRDLPMYTWVDRPSDSWYGCLRGDDPLPEVAVGRITGRTAAQVSVHVQKIIKHNETRDELADWRKRVLLVSHSEDSPGKYQQNSEDVRKRRYRAPSVSFVTAYGSRASNDDVVARIEQGAAIVNYRGHGTKDAWEGWNGGDFTAAQASALQNGDKLPIVLSVACWNMALSATSVRPTIAEAFVHNPNGGAVAYLGATRPSFTQPNHDFNRYLFRALLDSGTTTIGPLLMQANARLYAQYGDDDSALANLHMYAWLGDPALRVGRAMYTPPALSPNGVIINEVLADPPNGAAGDANGDGTRHFAEDELVEIVNANNSAVDLSGYTIADEVGVRFTFPAGTTLDAGKAIVVFGGGDKARFAAMGGTQVLVAAKPLQLNNDGDTVTLAAPDGRLVDRLSYSRSDARDRAMVRARDGDPSAPFVPHPGERAFSPGLKADGTPF
ncbi:MAG: lamin tail domain-containing protein [Myxococcales bacterium]|nr:lamin tail domain-containing protein [Myxococcales bacterium]